MPHPSKDPIVVIGSGASAVAAALTLARHGRRVTLVEKNGWVAPLLRRFTRGGVYCDPGFHYSGGLAAGGSLSVLLEYFGIRERFEPRPMDPEGFDCLVDEDGREVRIPAGLANQRESLQAHFPQSRAAADAYIAHVERGWRETPFISYDMDVRQVAREPEHGESLAALLGRCGAEPALATLLDRYSWSLAGTGAAEIPCERHRMVMGSFCQGAYTLARGGDEFADAFEARLHEMGVEVLLGRAVTELVLDGRRLTGVRLEDGETLTASACIGTLHPHRLLALMPGAVRRPPALEAWAHCENTYAPFMVFLDTEQIPGRLNKSNYYRFIEPGEPARASGAHDFLAVLSHEGHAAPGTNAPAHRAALCAFSPCLERVAASDGTRLPDEAYRTFKQRQTERVMRRLLESFPELAGRCRVVETLSPAAYESLTGTAGGAIYGLQQSVHRPPPSAWTGIGGLYLAGQSVLMNGVLGAMISGVIAAAHLIDLAEIWSAIQQCR